VYEREGNKEEGLFFDYGFWLRVFVVFGREETGECSFVVVVETMRIIARGHYVVGFGNEGDAERWFYIQRIFFFFFCWNSLWLERSEIVTAVLAWVMFKRSRGMVNILIRLERIRLATRVRATIMRQQCDNIVRNALAREMHSLRDALV
jgi:hypothetical protein